MSLGKITVEGSARHVHVTKEALAALFGEGYELHNKRELSQPGQYLTEEKVRVEGPRGGMDRVSILGPERKNVQVEISLTDARTLGIETPVRESGDIAGSGACRIVGPAGSLDITEGVIAAKRHIHLRPEDAQALGVANGQLCSVRVGGERGLVFNEVVVRVSPSFMPAMHIDYDEVNAAGLAGNAEGEIIV
ncbi:MAG: phosphate propanoyltransferase [Oscillospiraceae bacterium]|jgi:putative phosphotransacetylase|nr:phosphate propanoyltransferase [Oscillospiraceae bacterium]